MERERLDSFAAVLEAAARFRDERNWAQFHTPENLAAAVAVEAAELQEIFLWAPERDVPLEPRSSIASRRSSRMSSFIARTLRCSSASIWPQL